MYLKNKNIKLISYPKEIQELIKQYLQDDNLIWKQCKKCKLYFPVHVVFFMKEKRIKDGYENSCRKCRTGNYLSPLAYENPDKYQYKVKEKKGIPKSYFDDPSKIIEEYEKYLHDDIIPYNEFITDNFDIIIHYLIESKYNLSDDDILKLNRDWMQDHKLYGYYLRHFNGSIVQMIEHVYPNRFMPWEFIIVAKQDYWNNKDNIDKALKWLVDKLYRDNIISNINDIPIKVTNKLIAEYGLAGINTIFNHVYNIFNYLYPGKFYPWEYTPCPQGYFSIKDNRNIAFKQLIENRLYINVKDVPKLISYEYFNLHSNYRKFQAMINEYYDFNINELIKECYPVEYVHMDLPYKNHYLTLDNIIVRSEPERMIHHILIHNFKDQVIYEPRYFYDAEYDRKYLPDWIIYYNNKIIIIEYYGMLNMPNVDWGYDKRYEDKDNFYNNLCKINNKYMYIPIYKEDLQNGMQGLISKFNQLQISVVNEMIYYK